MPRELIQNDMIRWLRSVPTKPFMMFYAITLPHGRHEIDDYGIYRDQPWTEKQKAYAAQVNTCRFGHGRIDGHASRIGNRREHTDCVLRGQWFLIQSRIRNRETI